MSARRLARGLLLVLIAPVGALAFFSALTALVLGCMVALVVDCFQMGRRGGK